VGWWLAVDWGLTLGAGVAAALSGMSLIIVFSAAFRPEFSGVSITPYGSISGRLLRNLVKVHRSLVIPAQ
jgi:hypothetical protein